MATPAAPGSSQTLEALHRELLTDKSLQFRFEEADPYQPPPEWLETLARLLGYIAPYLTYIFWIGVAVLVGLVLYMIALELIRRLPTQAADAKAAPREPPKPQFHPAVTRARALLEEADRLAREGRYGEAVRILLHRSIEDMEEAFPSAIALSMTSREIGRIEHLSEGGRATFVIIASAVEYSLFAGRALTEAQFAACRRAYESFALGAQTA